MMRTRRSRRSSDSDERETFWPSFADLTSTVALILFVLVLLAFMKSLASGATLKRARADLDATVGQMAEAERALRTSRARLQSTELDLQATAAQLQADRARLEQSDEKIRLQEQFIADSNRELQRLRARLQSAALLRVSVLQRVQQALEAQLRTQASTQPLVSVADSGNIAIHESLVFEYDSYVIKATGKPLLRTLANAFGQILDDAEVRDSIEVIAVQGHSDVRGSAAYNRQLSAERANAVLEFMFGANPTLAHKFGAYFASSAYSEFRPIDAGRTEDAHRKNRRIELAVVLRDAKIRETIGEYLRESSVPAAP